MKRLLPLLLLTLALPATAHAGGWASVGLSPLPPRDLEAGQPWNVDITVLQHARTPLEGVTPHVVTRAPDGTERRFAGRPTDEPGVYRATVVFERAGRHGISADDGFTNATPHTFAPAEVLPAGTAASVTPPREGFPWGLFLGALTVLALVGAVAATAAARARRAAAWSASPR